MSKRTAGATRRVAVPPQRSCVPNVSVPVYRAAEGGAGRGARAAGATWLTDYAPAPSTNGIYPDASLRRNLSGVYRGSPPRAGARGHSKEIQTMATSRRSGSARGATRKSTTTKRTSRTTAAAKQGKPRQTKARPTRSKAVAASPLKSASSETSYERAKRAAERTMERATDTARRAKTEVTRVARDVADTVRGTDNRTKAGVVAAIIGVTAAAVTVGKKRRK